MKLASLTAIPLQASFADIYGGADQVPSHVRAPAAHFRRIPRLGQFTTFVIAESTDGAIGYGECFGLAQTSGPTPHDHINRNAGMGPHRSKIKAAGIKSPGRTGGQHLTRIEAGPREAPEHRRTSRSGRGYAYHTCASKAQRGLTACKGNTVPMAALDNLVLKALEERLFAPKRLAEVLSSLIARRAACAEALDARRVALQGEVASAEERLRRLYRMVEESVAELDDLLRERIAALKAERAKAALERAHQQCGGCCNRAGEGGGVRQAHARGAGVG